MTDDLSLYLYDGCPFCERVRRAVRELGIELEERNIFHDPEHMTALMEARGRRTVPVLRIHHEDGEDEWMPESADIVRYLHERFGEGDEPPSRGLWELFSR